MLKCLALVLIAALMVLLFITRWDRMKLGFKVFAAFWLGMGGLYLFGNWDTILAQGRIVNFALVAVGSLAVYGIAWLIFNKFLIARRKTKGGKGEEDQPADLISVLSVFSSGRHKRTRGGDITRRN